MGPYNWAALALPGCQARYLVRVSCMVLENPVDMLD